MFPYKKASILGLGKTGIATANFLYSKKVEVFVSESADKDKAAGNLSLLNEKIKYEIGGHTEKIFNSGLIIKSPGIPSDLPILLRAKQKNIRILSEIELAASLIKPKLLVAITGTNGKTTTTMMVGEVFKSSGFKTVVAGNIGMPLISFVDDINSDTVVVVEVSSYQLEDTEKFKPGIACILNITPDHLEHHKTMENYINVKENIFRNQTKEDYCILNYDDENCRKMSGKYHSTVVFVSQKQRLKAGISYDSVSKEVFISLPFLKPSNYHFSLNLIIPGRHNIENALFTLSAGILAGIEPELIKKTLESFQGVEHRLELVRKINGIKYINDSKSTNVDSTFVALESFSGNVILIMGGRHKGASYTPLKNLVKDKVKKLLLIGEAAEIIEKDLTETSEIIEVKTLKNAVKIASETAKPGDVVLLSPGCSSFDQFDNFEQRGSEFKKLVNSLN
ncbi:MAG: UDP-N-acetylmuramoyl-L-alanine--D-glutamate ligase [Elusimicrobia bacterium]|nr:UDP-N-acetylmuramoyl-L-alanine--D-glutamate ligase [Elusimicrobiota bacterium]MBU2615331.1 UDP-N-acetylmuramoyl-L-alanine--D-glutamate ligase [Elusimicrobiota bacterium]